MPRGVAKAKDGDVGNKDKGDVKRSRKMRGGGETFKEYCEEFVKGNKDEYTRAKKFVKDMFNNLYYAIDKIDIEIDRWGKKRSIFSQNPDKAAKKEALQIILKILKKTNDVDEENEEEEDENGTMQEKEKDPVKGIQGIQGIQGIDNKDLKILLVYINSNTSKIITSFNVLKKEKNEQNIKGLEQFQNSIIIDTTKLTKLFQNILFLKIYKLFEEFADISSAVTIISDIKIKKKEDDIPQDREALNPNGILNTDEIGGLHLKRTDTNKVEGEWFDVKTIDDRQDAQRRKKKPSATALSDRTDTYSTSAQTNRASAVQQQTDNLGVIQENATSDSKDTEDIGKILEYSIEDVQKKIVLNKDETIEALDKVYNELINTAEFKRIEKIKKKLRTNQVQKGVVIGMIDDLITTKYNKVIEIIKQQNIRDGSIDVLIEIIQGQAIKELNDVENIVRQYITSSTMNEEDKNLIKDAGELAKITNDLYISILRKYIGFLKEQNETSNEIDVTDDDEQDDSPLDKKALIRNIKEEFNKEDIEGMQDMDDIRELYEHYKGLHVEIITEYVDSQLFKKYRIALRLIRKGLKEEQYKEHIKEINLFISSISEDKVYEEKTKIISKINNTISVDKKDEAIKFINEVYKQTKRLNNIYILFLKSFIEQLEDPNQLEKSASQQGNDLDPSKPSNLIVPVLTIESIYTEKKKLGEKLKAEYDKQILAIGELVKDKKYYKDYTKRVTPYFEELIIKAFKILNVANASDAIKDIEQYINNKDNAKELFKKMQTEVNDTYGENSPSKKEGFALITKIQGMITDFQMFCYDELNIAHNNNINIQIWNASGGQPRKPPRKKHTKNTDATAMKPKAKKPTSNNPKVKEPIKTPNAMKPTKTPKAMKPAKEPKANKPTKNPDAMKPTKTPKQKEQTTKDTKAMKPTKTPKQIEPKAKKPTKK